MPNSELSGLRKESYCNVKLKWPVTGQHTVIINADVLQVLYKEVVWLKDFLKKPENHIYFNLSLGREQYIITYISLHFILINISKLHIHKNGHKF